MKIIAGGRRSGKTTRMLQWFLEGSILPGYNRAVWSRTIICINESAAQYTRQRLMDMLVERQGVSWYTGSDPCDPSVVRPATLSDYYGGVQIKMLLEFIGGRQLASPQAIAGRYRRREMEYGIDDLNYDHGGDWLQGLSHFGSVVLATWNGNLEVENL